MEVERLMRSSARAYDIRRAVKRPTIVCDGDRPLYQTRVGGVLREFHMAGRLDSYKVRRRRVARAVVVVLLVVSAGCQGGDDGDDYLPTTPTPMRLSRPPALGCVDELEHLFRWNDRQGWFDFDVRFRNGCSEGVSIFMRASLFDPNGMADRSSAGTSESWYEAGVTRWHCTGHDGRAPRCNLDDFGGPPGRYAVRYTWTACYGDEFLIDPKCEVDYPDED